MNIRIALLATAAAGMATLAASNASAQAAFGSAAFGTYRDCAGLTVCDGNQPGQAIIGSAISGGISSTSNTSFTLSGQTQTNLFGHLVTLPNDPASSVTGVVTFGASDLPVLNALSTSGATDRMGINAFGYQSYTNTGTTATPFDISGSLNIDSFSGTDGGVFAGGAIATTYVGIWAPSLITNLGSVDAQTLFDDVFLAPCGTAGVLAAASNGVDLTTGSSTTLNSSAGTCSGSPLILAPQETVLVVAGLQLLTNRGGEIDAMDTFTTSFGADVQTQDLLSGEAALPEPAAWALMTVGFLGLGAGIRRRRARLAIA